MMGARSLTVVIGILAVLATTVLGAPVPARSEPWAPAEGERASVDSATGTTTSCTGEIPAGWAVSNGLPYFLTAPMDQKVVYQPQTISAFIALSARDPRNTPEQRRCWSDLGVRALIKGSRTYVLPSGATARVFPYGYDFRASPMTPVMKAGWVSALGHSSAIVNLMNHYRRNGDEQILTYAKQAFEAFTVDSGPYAMVSRENGLTYLQEYPTTPKSYVLNGHGDAIINLSHWYAYSGDPRAKALRDEALAALSTTLALSEIPTPQAVATSYDLLRGFQAARLRFVGGAAIRSPRLVAGGQDLGALPLPVVRDPVPAPNLLSNPGLRGAPPSGWIVNVPSALSVTQTGGRAIRLTSADQLVSFSQAVPASRVEPGRDYRISLRAQLIRTGAKASGRGMITMWAVCPTGSRILVRAQVRWTGGRAWADGKATAPSGRCGLRYDVTVYPDRPTVLEFDQASLSLADPPSPGVDPTGRYPLSVLEHPDLAVRMEYSGFGRIEGLINGRWIPFGTVPPTVRPATAEIAIPGWAQGRNINFTYHQHHVYELDWLLQNTDCGSLCRDYGRRWLDYAPDEWGRLTNFE